MCGIFYFECTNSGKDNCKFDLNFLRKLQSEFVKLSHRGPDNSIFVNDQSRVFGFHRLAINGHLQSSNQPFHLKNCRLICNGEIYNYKALREENGFAHEYMSDSDCEIIVHLYKKYGIMQTLKMLDGVFAFVLHDYISGETFVARDPVGVRSLYMGLIDYYEEEYGSARPITNSDCYQSGIAIASEMKALSFCNFVAQFPAGCYMQITEETITRRYPTVLEGDGGDSGDGGAEEDCENRGYTIDVTRAYFYAYYKNARVYEASADNAQQYVSPMLYNMRTHLSNIRTSYKYFIKDNDNDSGLDHAAYEAAVCETIRTKFTDAVRKRLMSERPVGCLLSGGLDSSVTTALVHNMLQAAGAKTRLNTYSIGLKGSVDLEWARKVANYLGTNHHEVCLSENEFLRAIDETICQIESYCTTTVRASVGNYLVSKYIYEAGDDVVIYCGDMSDEIFGSYRGFLKAATDEDFMRENERMIQDVRFFDLLRSDKSISGAGLEARVPFADKEFLEYVMSIPPCMKRFDDSYIEKYLFRKAFTGVLPTDVLWRRKEAFSDGVSGTGNERTWLQIIKDFVDTVVSDEEYANERQKYHHNMPYDKESYYYRRVFEKYYSDLDDTRARTIPYFWRHPFCEDVLDPSARLLSFYKQ